MSLLRIPGKPPDSGVSATPELQGSAVDAVALTGGGGTVTEHVSEMGIAASTENLPAHHSMASIFLGCDGSRADPLPETWPAGAGVEFAVGTEQRNVTTDAVVHPAVLEIPVSAGKGPFRASLACHLELFRSQLLTPLLRGAFNTIAAGS